MNKSSILAAAALCIASSSFAFQTAEDPPPFAVETGAPVSRAQVQAELQEYRQRQASGPAYAEDAAPTSVATGTPVSRAQVQAELQQYRQRQASGPAYAEDPAPRL